MAVPKSESRSPGVPAPVSAASDGATAEVLRAEPNENFLLVVYPDSPTGWTVETRGLDRPTFLPSLHVVPLVEGANGMRTVSKGEDLARGMDGLYNRLRQNGAIIIDPAKYRLKTPCRGGFYYHTPWQILRQPLAGQQMIPKTDHALYAAFRLSLVTDGIVPPPDDQVLAYAESRAQDRITTVDTEAEADSPERRDARKSKAQRKLDNVLNAHKPWIAEAPKAKARRGEVADE